jgi:hypothetical protein
MRVKGSVFRDFGKVARSKELKSRLFLHRGGLPAGPLFWQNGLLRTERNSIPYSAEAGSYLFETREDPENFSQGIRQVRPLETNGANAKKAVSPAMKKLHSP